MEKNLVALSYMVRDASKKFMASAKYSPTYDAIEAYTVDSLAYDKTGIKSSSGGIHLESQISSRSVLSAVFNNIKSTSEYKAAAQSIENEIGEDKKFWLDQHINLIVNDLVDKGTLSKRQIQRYAARFIKDLQAKSISYSVRVGIAGVTIESEKPINLSKGITLRRPNTKDLSTKRMIGSPSFNDLNSPTAILEFKVHDRPNSGIAADRKTRFYLTVLRLFCTGGIQRVTLATSTRSPISHGSGFINSGNVKSPDKYFLRIADERRLRKFIKVIEHQIPGAILDGKLDDEVGIAYDRYKKALEEKSPLELRISNTIMGLEALYCTESTEVGYRLKNRVAKLAGYWDYGTIETRELISVAYDIRSRYSHGETASHNKLNKLKELSVSLGSDNALVEILRTTIVLFCGLQDGKKELIQACDDAFINKGRPTKLDTMLKDCKTLTIM